LAREAGFFAREAGFFAREDGFGFAAELRPDPELLRAALPLRDRPEALRVPL
jgi:hypothetical protein